MNDHPALLIYVQQTFTAVQDTFIDSTAKNNNAVVFEDNEETGYFYAIDSGKDLYILDALHIYNVSDVVVLRKPSTLKILWTGDLTKAFLSINNYYHAVLILKNKAGYCRTAFPNSNDSWTVIKDRLLTDELIEHISNNI